MDSVVSLNRAPMDGLTGSLNMSTRPSRQAGSRQKALAGAYVALLLFLLIYFSRPEDWIPGLSHVPFAKLAGVLVLFALFASVRDVKRRIPREVILLGVLIVQLAAASLFSPVWRGGALLTTLAFAKVGLIVLSMWVAVNTALRFRRMIFIQAASVAVIAVVAIWKHHSMGGRLEGVLGAYYTDPNDLALAIIIAIPLCMAFTFRCRSRVRKVIWVLAVLMMLYAVFLTGSRGGFVALVITTAAFMWEFAIGDRRHYLLGLTLLAGVILWQFSSGMLVGRLKGTLDAKENSGGAYDSAQIRRDLFWRSVELSIRHPVFGVGPGNFQQFAGNWYVTHNSFTQMSAEGGIPAFVVYLSILWYGFENLKKTKRLSGRQAESRLWARALQVSLIGYCVGSTFLSAAFEYFPYILLAYTTVLFSVTRNASKQTRKEESFPQANAEMDFRVEMPGPKIFSYTG